MTTRRRWRWRLLAVVAALLIAALAVEAALRMTRELPDYIAADSELGWSLRPGVSGWTMDNENNAWVAINRRGLFDREHALAKPDSTLRVAVLGDSFMSTFNLPFEKTFVAFFEQQLGTCRPASRAIEAINFGVPGYGTAQQLLTYRARARAYAPDIVLLMLYVGNDILNNHPALNPSGDAPYFVIREDQLTLMPPPPPQPDAPRAGRAHLPFYQRARLFVTDRSRAAALLYGEWARLRNGEPPAAPYQDPRQDAVYREPRDANLIEAWRVTEALVRQLAAEVRTDGAEFWLVTLPTSEQVDPSADARRATAARYQVSSLSYATTRIRDFAAAHDIPVIGLQEPLADVSARRGINLFGGYTAAVPAGTGHWNETGNRAAAAIVAERLCSQSRAITGG